MNIDGIKKISSPPKVKITPVIRKRAVVAFSDVAVRPRNKVVVAPSKIIGGPMKKVAVPAKAVLHKTVTHYALPVAPAGFFNKFKAPRLPLVLTATAMLLAFFGGVWWTLSANYTEAEALPPINTNYIIPLVSLPKGVGPIDSLPNEALFNLPLEQLEIYLNNLTPPPPVALSEEQIIAQRAEKLKLFLQERNSPFADYADVLAAQPHWKLMLAIAFAESTLGKNCVNNNCSNIGVKPGHPMWRKYPTYKEWLIDFNSLLERRYKNWTLEEMNGVYVQPKNPNWMLATKQILSALQEKGIE